MSTRLPAFGNVARVALWGGSRFGVAGGDPESSSCRRAAGESFTPYVLRSVTVSPQPGWFKNVMPSMTARDYLSYGGEWLLGNAMKREA